MGARKKIEGAIHTTDDRLSEREKSKQPDPFAELKKLQKQVDAQKVEEYEEKKRPNTVMREATRRPDPDADQQIERALRLEGLMTKEQIHTMETAHFVISHHYMNPAFMLRAEALGDSNPKLTTEGLYKALDTVLQHPYDYNYFYDAQAKTVQVVQKSNVKRSPAVSLEINTAGGSGGELITKVNGVELKSSTGRLPWENIDYPEVMEEYEKTFNYQLRDMVEEPIRYPEVSWDNLASPESAQNLLDAQTRITNLRNNPDELQKIYGQMSPKLKDMFAHHHVTLPFRLIQLIKARNLDFEKNDPAVKALLDKEGFLKALKKKSTAEQYAKLTQDPTNMPIKVYTDKKQADVYIIKIPGPSDQELHVHKNGYIMRKNSNDYWIPHPEYKYKLREDYFEANKGKDARSVIEFEDYAEKLRENGESAKKIEELRQNDEYMRPVLEAFQKMNWKQCGELYLAFSPAEKLEKRKAMIKWFTEELEFQPGFEPLLVKAVYNELVPQIRKDRDKIRKAAQVLGVTLSATP
jgi:aerobic-type carbon monoxide dehydrogenase small subunit (CoxS/CutS family)